MNQAFTRWHIERISECGESAIILYFSGANLLEQNQHVAQLFKALKCHYPDWLNDLVPGFDSLMLNYDPALTEPFAMIHWLANITSQHVNESPGKIYEVGVDYQCGTDFDLNDVSKNLGLSVEETINLHQLKPLRVYAIGFAPHFCYLGELPEKLKVGRLAKPRLAVPAGAVAIADSYSAVYPASSPGGWQLLGTVSDISAFLALDLHVGDAIQFVTHSVAGR